MKDNIRISTNALKIIRATLVAFRFKRVRISVTMNFV